MHVKFIACSALIMEGADGILARVLSLASRKQLGCLWSSGHLLPRMRIYNCEAVKRYYVSANRQQRRDAQTKNIAQVPTQARGACRCEMWKQRELVQLHTAFIVIDNHSRQKISVNIRKRREIPHSRPAKTMQDASRPTALPWVPVIDYREAD